MIMDTNVIGKIFKIKIFSGKSFMFHLTRNTEETKFKNECPLPNAEFSAWQGNRSAEPKQCSSPFCLMKAFHIILHYSYLGHFSCRPLLRGQYDAWFFQYFMLTILYTLNKSKHACNVHIKANIMIFFFFMGCVELIQVNHILFYH